MKVVLFTFIFFSAATLVFFVNLHPQEGDDCSERDAAFKSTFNGSVLYGDYGSTSQLDRKEKFDRYKPANAFDESLETSWVEGREDEGSGEILAFFKDKEITEIAVLPGYGTTKYFFLNNRIKSAKFSAYEASVNDADQCLGTYHKTGKLLTTRILDFEDRMKYQRFGISGIPSGLKGYIYTIEIISVYRGTKYNDTCIAGIRTE